MVSSSKVCAIGRAAEMSSHQVKQVLWDGQETRDTSTMNTWWNEARATNFAYRFLYNLRRLRDVWWDFDESHLASKLIML
jgi:hypothetical protein